MNLNKTKYSEEDFSFAMKFIASLAKIPMVHVDREQFLRQVFKSSEYIDTIIEKGPLAVYTVDSVRKKANEIINATTKKSSFASFVSGLPSSIVTMAASGSADVTQYFLFALNLAQKIAYLFNEDEIFASANGNISEESQVRMVSYLGAMLGVNGATSLIAKTSQKMGASIGKQVTKQALTKTAWYPLFKKIASSLGYQVTKNTVGKIIEKSVPILGGVLSGGITYLTFKPMGSKLADAFVKIANGELDDDLELNPEFIKATIHETKKVENIIDADSVDVD